MRLSPNLCPPGLVAAALVVQSGSCGPFAAVLVLALPRTRRCSLPSRQEFPLSPWQPMKSPGHRMCLCTFCWGRRGEGAELCSVSSTLAFFCISYSPSKELKLFSSPHPLSPAMPLEINPAFSSNNTPGILALVLGSGDWVMVKVQLPKANAP